MLNNYQDWVYSGASRLGPDFSKSLSLSGTIPMPLSPTALAGILAAPHSVLGNWTNDLHFNHVCCPLAFRLAPRSVGILEC